MVRTFNVARTSYAYDACVVRSQLDLSRLVQNLMEGCQRGLLALFAKQMGVTATGVRIPHLPPLL